ncbi:LysR family transcriptional regulator [Photobacterium sanguinicancri]|uniref:LysR family transcriptional regulator n=1 Tax=Photobacterium sanguinicancri TaxID=875932 RepID=A0ABX4FTY4_9GAMM|nr:LysR family transcriptional regulator [Photobacterium sanguinicancri]OZS42312.1 LysR family transcriptional regulator [Photobacterium sanguinicancri]
MNRKLSDLNQIKLLIDLAHTQNMSRTARRLGKTTSAVSKSLQKVREELGDELFVRQSSGLKLTPYAVGLITKLKRIQKEIDRVFEGECFDPRTFSGKISIASNSALLKLYQPKLFQALKSQAPLADIEIVLWQESSYQSIADSEIHLGLHFENLSCSQSVTQRVVGHHHVSLVVSKQHQASNLQQALSSPLAILKVNGWNSDSVNFTQYLSRQGIDFNIGYQTEDLSSLLDCIASSDLVAPLPSFLVRDGLRSITLDASDSALSAVACIPTTHRNDAFYLWLVSVVKSIV